MKYLLTIVLCILLFGCAATQPNKVAVDLLQLPVIGGTLTKDLLLDGNYLLASDLQVPAGITLTISPGTTIYVQPAEGTKIDPEFLSREVEVLIRGSLRAVGTAARPIVFKPVTEDPEAILWSGLQLVGSELVRLEHLTIEQAEVAVLCLDASPQIRSLQIRRSRYGILLQQQSAPLITDSLLVDGEAGLFCWDNSAPQVSNSFFLRQQEEGLYLGRDCRGSFTGNQIERNDRGVVLPVGVGFDLSNHVSGNRHNFYYYPAEQN